MSELFGLLFTSLIVNNVILTQFLGMCPFMGVSKKRTSALGMGVAVVFVIVAAYYIWFILSCPCSFEIGIYGFDYLYSSYRVFGTINGNVY